MQNKKALEWVLRIGVAGEFLGHGVLAFTGKADWIGWIQSFLSVDSDTAKMLLTLIGAMDILMALIVLVKPIRIFLLWMAFWGFWTALVRPLIGGTEIWDFIERFANWAAPLALLLSIGWPRGKEWFR